MGFATQRRDLANRVADHAACGNPSIPVTQPLGAVRQRLDEIAVIYDAEAQAHDA